MKTLVTILAVLVLPFTGLSAKDATFTSVIIPDGGTQLHIHLSSGQWIKITNFTQNDTGENHVQPAGVAVFKGGTGLWVLFASNPNEHTPHEDLFVAGPATVIVSPPEHGAIVFATYERGSD